MILLEIFFCSSIFSMASPAVLAWIGSRRLQDFLGLRETQKLRFLWALVL